MASLTVAEPIASPTAPGLAGGLLSTSPGTLETHPLPAMFLSLFVPLFRLRHAFGHLGTPVPIDAGYIAAGGKLEAASRSKEAH